MGKRMDAVRVSKSWLFSETIVWTLFVVISITGALSLMKLINLSGTSIEWVGRVLFAYGILAFVFLAYKATLQRMQ